MPQAPSSCNPHATRARLLSHVGVFCRNFCTGLPANKVFAKDWDNYEDKAKGMLAATIRTTCTHRVARHALHMICPLACAHTCNRQMCRSQSCMRYLTATWSDVCDVNHCLFDTPNYARVSYSGHDGHRRAQCSGRTFAHLQSILLTIRFFWKLGIWVRLLPYLCIPFSNSHGNKMISHGEPSKIMIYLQLIHILKMEQHLNEIENWDSHFNKNGLHSRIRHD
jgi:hypothetical protein